MKDPAVLFYIGDWLKSTAELDADTRGWYLNLLLHNYDKQDLPSNIEDLATLAVVKFSEFNRFKQVFEQVLNNKFELLDTGRLSNPRINEILKKRENFVEKRSNAGKISYVMKYLANNYPKEFKNKKMCNYIKNNFEYDIDLKNQAKIKQVFEHLFELYINEDENEDEFKDKDKSKVNNMGFDFSKSSEEFKDYFLNEFIIAPKQSKKTQNLKAKILIDLQGYDEPFAIELMKKAVLNNWQGYKFNSTDEQYADYLRKKNNPNSSQWGNGTTNGVQRASGKQSYFFDASDIPD